jgi:hypothetical protein
MARKQDNRAARERKQKIFVAVAGVLFLGLMALQGPKLLKQLKGSEPAATTAATSSGSSSEAGGANAAASGDAEGTPVSPSAVSLAATAPKNAQAKLAGVVIVREQPASPGEGQLRSFTEFESKDPFVQQVDPEQLPTPAEVGGRTGSTAPPQSGGGGQAAPPASAGGGSAPAPTTGGTTGAPLVPTPAPALTMAMLRVNGKVQFVELKKRFPSSDKAFVLRKLLRGKAVIGVAGGSFGPGKSTLTLQLGKAVTLVNTATGARYVIRLVYVGADAKQVTGFTAR